MTATATSMRSALRRSLYWVFGAGVLGGIAVALALPSATAAPDPCAASQIARTIAAVSTNTGNYLDAHPDTNAVLTSAAKQQPPQALASLKTYFDANPQAGKDMTTLQQPLQSLASQCKLPISVPQALQMMQGPGQGGLPQLPGTSSSSAQPSPLGATTPGASTSVGPSATGPAPGPATVVTR